MIVILIAITICRHIPILSMPNEHSSPTKERVGIDENTPLRTFKSTAAALSLKVDQKTQYSHVTF